MTEGDFAQSDYLSGLTDGEGCFIIGKQPTVRSFQMVFCIKLRSDDNELLKLLQQHYGGRLHLDYERSANKSGINANPQSAWKVCGRRDILRLIDYFDKHPLRSTKADEYIIWREAAFLYYRHSVGSASHEPNSSWLADAMMAYRLELQRLKKYRAIPKDLELEPNFPQLELLMDERNE